MKDFPEITTNKIKLRKLFLEDYNEYVEYVIDFDIARQFLFDYTPERAQNRLEEIIKRYDTDKQPFIWAIAHHETNELIGIISLDNISFKNKNFSIACGIRKEFRKNGYGYEAIKTLAKYIFENYDMNRLQLSCNEDNIASIKIFEKMGLVFEGIAREAKYYDGKFKNKKIYSMLKSEIDNLERK